MKKLTKCLLIGCVILSLGGSVFSSALVVSIREALEQHRRNNVYDVVAMRTRINELESTLTGGIAALADKALEVMGTPETESNLNLSAGEEESDREGNGEVTHSDLHAAEDPAVQETVQQYVITEYRGIIGVYDQDGALLRTVNVAVDTLPEADRAALEVGIYANSWQEMMDIVSAMS